MGKACPAGVASEAGDGFMQVFLNDFDARNPFVAGGRHAFVLKLGRVARYKGFSPEEMRLLQKAVVEKYAQADFGSGEIEKTLSSGYQYVSARRADAMTTDLGPKVQGPFYGMPAPQLRVVFRHTSPSFTTSLSSTVFLKSRLAVVLGIPISTALSTT